MIIILIMPSKHQYAATSVICAMGKEFPPIDSHNGADNDVDEEIDDVGHDADNCVCIEGSANS